MSELSNRVAQVEREAREARAEVERLRSAPAVCAVDVEAAAKEIADGFELHLGDDDTRTESLIVAILRKNTRAVSVEEVARAIHEEAMRGDTWERIVKDNPVALALRFSAARAALRARVAELEEMLRDAHRRIEPSANEEGGAWARVLLNDIEEVLTATPEPQQ